MKNLHFQSFSLSLYWWLHTVTSNLCVCIVSSSVLLQTMTTHGITFVCVYAWFILVWKWLTGVTSDIFKTKISAIEIIGYTFIYDYWINERRNKKIITSGSIAENCTCWWKMHRINIACIMRWCDSSVFIIMHMLLICIWSTCLFGLMTNSWIYFNLSLNHGYLIVQFISEMFAIFYCYTVKSVFLVTLQKRKRVTYAVLMCPALALTFHIFNFSKRTAQICLKFSTNVPCILDFLPRLFKSDCYPYF